MRGSARNTRAATASIPHSRLLIAVLILAAVVAAGASAEAASLPLTWNAPTTNANGTPLTDLGGYRVYIGTTTPACPSSSFHAVSSPTSSPTSGQTVSTRISALTADTTYVVRLTAVDTSGNESACTGSVSGAALADVTVTPTGATTFGSITVNGTVDRTFTVQNTSTASISVTASVGSPFSIVSGGSGSLAAGASRVVTVRFRPTTVGTFAGNVTFTGGGDTISRALSGSSTSAPTFALTVTKNGTGSGTVSSSPAGISCGTDCAETAVQGTQFTLTATAASGSTFTGWSGACSGSGSCTVTVNAARAVTATFTALAPPVALSVTKNGTGSGTVTSAPAGIACGADCAESLAVGTPVTLTATAASGSVFAGWSGACSGTAATCAWTMSAATAVTATFNTDRVDRPLDPVPAVTSLSPTSVTVGGAAFTLTVNGTGFAATSVVRWNGADRQTTFVSATRLRAAITTADRAIPGKVAVSVFTPAPGGGTSGNLNFSVIAPPPVAGTLSPASTPAGTAGLTLTVNGSSFVATSVVRWNGSARPTTVVSATQLRATITAADLASTGSIPVSVFTPAPGGGTSASRTFTITTPTTPPAAPAAPGNLSVTTRATDASGVTFDVAWGAATGAASYRYAAAFSDGSAAQQGTITGLLSFQLRMPYHASGAAFGGFVCVRSVGPTGLQSAEQACGALSVPARPPAPPVPVTSSLSPASAVAGSTGITLTVNGSGFVATSVVRWNGTARPTTVVSATQLRATISAADLASAGSVPVTVFTPAPGGGTSASQSFVITTASAPSTPPAMPGPLSVTLRSTDTSGVTFDISWSAASGAASYSYVAAFADGSASQQGTVTGPSLQLRMPYHRTGAAFGGFVCVRSVSAAGVQSSDHACAALSVPAPR
jgi:List-Bact-rpt repeat protein/centrosomal CEP192-like protein